MRFIAVLAIMYAVSIALVACLAVTTYGLPETQIVGGKDAPVGMFPYQVSLRKNGRHFCGGSILSTRYVLTAAHCVDGYKNPGSITVHAGTNLLNEQGAAYQVEKISSHPNYNSMLIINDVAVLRVNKNIEFNSKVQPVKLASGSKSYEGQNCILSGWGTTVVGGSTPNKLQYINLVIESQSKCKQTHWQVRDSHICTFTKRGEGACHGDSGGPLVVNGEQVGIVSFGRPCGVGAPDVYTRVTAFASWIKQQESFLKEAGEPEEIQVYMD
ncbi:chymotrypsin-1 [Calliopsis andreniformis]|uniref:chymotrypsin-1 n=1 Tax=Calliopsis andreniformis TaxID=337506 RepID=UPI003FCD83EC